MGVVGDVGLAGVFDFAFVGSMVVFVGFVGLLARVSFDFFLPLPLPLPLRGHSHRVCGFVGVDNVSMIHVDAELDGKFCERAKLGGDAIGS